ncbi:MAG: SufS family cysteine desulfurase [Planctomycetota bacterium]
MLDTNRIRADFPILSRKTASGHSLAFLDNAASSQRPQCVIDAVSACYEKYYANVHRGIHMLSEESTAAYEAARETTRGFMNASCTQEIIFTAGTTAAINTVAQSWGNAHLQQGDVVLLTIAEHHANIVPWHQLAERNGCRVEFIPLGADGNISDAAVEAALAQYRPKLFGFVSASNVLGSSSPVARWTELAHDAGATVLVDAAQTAPHQAMDVAAWNADFVVFSGHKVCGPSGIGVLYGKRSLLDAMPPFLVGGGMIDRVTTKGFTPAELPEKFEAGTPPIAQAIGLAEALRYLQSVGLDKVDEHERTLARRADKALREIDGLRILGPEAESRSGIISFTMKGIHAHDIAQWLDGRGVAVRAGHHCTMPLHDAVGASATARASFYLYNTEEEVDRLIEGVIEASKKFAPSGRRRRRSAPAASN